MVKDDMTIDQREGVMKEFMQGGQNKNDRSNKTHFDKCEAVNLCCNAVGNHKKKLHPNTALFISSTNHQVQGK